jgi:uncharacterized membrane protein
VLHIFGVVIWLGGLMYQNAVVRPVAQPEENEENNLTRKMGKRFLGFVWLSVWTIGVTGVLMMLFNPGFMWFQFNDRWSVLLGVKQVIFVLMVFYALGYARMMQYILKPSSNGGFDEKTEIYTQKIHQFRTISIALGILGIVVSAGMIR